MKGKILLFSQPYWSEMGESPCVCVHVEHRLLIWEERTREMSPPSLSSAVQDTIEH